MTKMSSTNLKNLRDRLNNETAKINWHDLQTHFALGNVMAVSRSADLIDTAITFHQDNRAKVQTSLVDKTLFEVSDALALQWYESNCELWALVIPPFVLVQET